jgi:hypothetical protein
MMAPHRLVLAAILLGVGLGVSGCETSDVVDKVQGSLQDFNPFGTAKKPLPGSRKALFPEGVPGVEQGVPSEMMPGAARPEAIPEPVLAAQPRVAEPKPRARRVRTTTAAAPPVERAPRQRRTRQPAAGQPPADGVWPAPPAPTAGRQQPARPAPAPAPQPAQQPGTAWPTPAPSSQPTPTIWPDPPK